MDGTDRPWPIQYYLVLCRAAETFTSSRFFTLYGLLIVFSVLIIGTIETYSELMPNSEDTFTLLDNIILYCFVAEAILKIMSEGVGPQLYFIGPNWDWNCFDFTIIILSLLPLGVGFIKILRLIRIIRIAKLYENIPELQMVVSGLFNSFTYNMHIFLLLMLLFYGHAILGIIYFGQNDPWNFGSLPVAMLTMLRIATLESSSEIFYINYYGCDVYPSNVYTNNMTLAGTQLGSVTYCSNPDPRPVIITIWYIEFIFIASFTVLALFIAAISLTMAESMYITHRKKEENRYRTEVKKLKQLLAIYTQPSSEIVDMNLLRRKQYITLAFSGQPLKVDENTTELQKKYHIYLKLGEYCRVILDTTVWRIIMIAAILISCITLGLETRTDFPPIATDTINMVDNIIKYIFLLEFILKIIVQDLQPWRYFYDNWNKLDFIVLIIVFIPEYLTTQFVFLRLLRLLRILRLSRVFPQLQIIIIAIGKGLGGIVVVALLLLLTIFFFGILGNILFAKNDPWHFATLHMR